MHDDRQPDAAEEAASRAINLFSDEGDQFEVCQSHHLLGEIYCAKGEMKKAINHFETALGIASPLNWHNEQFWIHHSLAKLFSNNNQFNNAHAHIEYAKSHTVGDPYNLGHAMELQARLWRRERKLEEAKSEALCAAGLFEKLGATKELERCRAILRKIEGDRRARGT